MPSLSLFEVALFYALSVAFWVGIPIGIFVLVRRLLRAIERRPVRESQIAELTERLQRLEARLEDIADETDRLRDDQRFTRQLLTEPVTGEHRSSPGAL